MSNSDRGATERASVALRKHPPSRLPSAHETPEAATEGEPDRLPSVFASSLRAVRDQALLRRLLQQLLQSSRFGASNGTPEASESEIRASRIRPGGTLRDLDQLARHQV